MTEKTNYETLKENDMTVEVISKAGTYSTPLWTTDLDENDKGSVVFVFEDDDIETDYATIEDINEMKVMENGWFFSEKYNFYLSY